MQYMGIVECVSSGRLYIKDIISHGYKPLIINVKDPTDYLVEYREIIAKGFGDDVEFIDEDDDFDTFIERLKGYDLKLVFPGCEYGVRLADRINNALGLRGNDASTTYLRCNKAGMNEALERAGIRKIESKRVTCAEDIRDFWKKYDLEKCVLKFTESAATVGLKICSSIDDALAHYELMRSTPTAMGELDAEILIQEYIGGTEYIVNTLSCDGRHMVTDMWVYAKVRSESGTLAYDYAKLIKDLEPGHTEMVEYVYDVLDAVEMKWGLCHVEIKIDKKGPVLIETNARPMGLAMTDTYLDEALGHHQTDLAVSVLLDPSRFKEYSQKRYCPRKYALMKLMIVPEDIKGSFAPTFVIGNMVRSTREILFFGKDGIASYHRTIDLDTSPLTIKMINEDYGALMKDYEMLRLIESNYFHLFYTLGEEIGALPLKTDIGRIASMLDQNRRFLIVKDDGEYISQYGKVEKASGWQIYDGAIYAICGKMSAEDRYRSIFRVMHNIRSGGVFIIVPESYRNMKSGSVMIEFLMNIAGLEITVPPYGTDGVIYGVKK